jgi:nitrite reductase/ring-hydroxylating ferredoxin subunit
MKNMDRKAFLKQMAALGIGAGMAASLPGCAFLMESEKRVCSLSELEAAGSVSIKFNFARILATRLEGEIVIFSLICSHKRCTVKWEAEEEQFECPCHEGVYDKYGEVVDGPPPDPLRRFKHEIRGEDLWVLNQFDWGEEEGERR